MNLKDQSAPLPFRSRMPRRQFLKLSSLGAAGVAALPLPIGAGPFEASDFEKLVPRDKRLDPDWVRSLFDRGQRKTYRGDELKHLGLPIGGVGAGQIYLAGDGRLWLWDIFNENRNTSWTGDHYRNPLSPASPLAQGFALQVHSGGQNFTKTLDANGFPNLAFHGEYPMGFVEYSHPAFPVEVRLEAFSPFIPLNAPDSALPAILLRFQVKNTASQQAECILAGWLENAVCLHSDDIRLGTRHNRILQGKDYAFLQCSAEEISLQPRAEKRPDLLFDDFEQAEYDGWTATGSAFGTGPVEQDRMPDYQGKVGAQGARLVNSHASAPGQNVTEKDAATGILTSRPFRIERDFITALVGGGAHKNRTCLRLLVKNQAVLSVTGQNDNRLSPQTLDVRRWEGQEGRLQIVDEEKGGWGNIGVDQIVFTDTPSAPLQALAEQPDFGTMGLAWLPDKSQSTDAAAQSLRFRADLSDPNALFNELEEKGSQAAFKPFGSKIVGGLGTRFTLEPGQSITVTFAVVWHFPNNRLPEFKEKVGRYYARRFRSARQVAEFLAREHVRLYQQTRLWHDTWYDSTLPWWFLDRAFVNTSTLATTTCHWFENGRFYGWEGVGCCAGTCLHVWQYAQAVARIFPEIERDLRERVDYGISFQPATGIIAYRGPEVSKDAAVDGQAGTVLRAYREHLMSPNPDFLRRLWPRIKRSLEYLIQLDSDRDGLLDQPQYNTLDDAWHGEIAWISSLYVAALRAGQAMAREMGDGSFAQQAQALAEQGSRAIASRLWNGEYFVHKGDPAHPKSPGSYEGCEIDQVYGQSWAWQVGLGRVLEEEKVKTALRSLWRYNFTPDIGPYRRQFPEGRWYALAGDGGLLMCTFPKGGADALKKGHPTFAAYFNECMTGFEYQVAAHMIWEGLVKEGLAIARMIHDRYHPLRRNPFNEIECGDHYARAMSSYGVYLAACGFEYHGPRGHLGFAPRLTPEQFRCAFTAAEGWGTYSQTIAGDRFQAMIHLRWGKLRLRTLSLAWPDSPSSARLLIQTAGQSVSASVVTKKDQVKIELKEELTLTESQALNVTLQI